MLGKTSTTQRQPEVILRNTTKLHPALEALGYSNTQKKTRPVAMQVFCDDESTHNNRNHHMRGIKAEPLRTPLDTNKSTLTNPEDKLKSPLLTKGKQNATTNKDGTAAGKANGYSRKLSSLPHDLSQQETTSTASTTKQPALSTDEVKQHNDCKPPPPKKSLCVFDPYDIKLTRTYWFLKGISESVKQPNRLL